MTKRNGTLRKISIIATLMVIFASIVGSWVLQKDAIADNTEDMVNLKEDGCDPADEAIARCLVLETHYKHTEASLKDLKAGQKVMLKAIQER